MSVNTLGFVRCVYDLKKNGMRKSVSASTAYLLLMMIILPQIVPQPSWADTYEDCFNDVVVKATGAAVLDNMGHLLKVSGLNTHPGGEDGIQIDLVESGGYWGAELASHDTPLPLPIGSALNFSVMGTVEEMPNSEIISYGYEKVADGKFALGVTSLAASYTIKAYFYGELVFTDTVVPDYPGDTCYLGSFESAVDKYLEEDPFWIFIDHGWDAYADYWQGGGLSARYENWEVYYDPWYNWRYITDFNVYPTTPPDNSDSNPTHLNINCEMISDLAFTSMWAECDARAPNFHAQEGDLAQDNFPTSQIINPFDLGSHSVRFDAARNISQPEEMANTPGDSVSFWAAPYREGAVLVNRPKGYYHLDPNPLFDLYRTSGLPNSGWVECDTTYNGTGGVVADTWHFDLPDVGFFFPGDVIHYYFEMQEDLSGDVLTFTLPADTTGYSTFINSSYNRTYTVRALPTLRNDGSGGVEHPDILFWDDSGTHADDTEWQVAFRNLGYVAGIDYDIYRTNDPLGGLGNGLGGRAAAATLSGYEDIIYTCGDLNINTISNGDFETDAGNDIGVLTEWLQGGNRDLMLTGNNLAYDLSQSGMEAESMLSNWIGVSFVSRDLGPLIGNERSPLVQAVAGNPVFVSTTDWQIYGCNICSRMPDAVTKTESAVSLAEYTDSSGTPGLYTYTAGVLNEVGSSQNLVRVIYLPYDLKNIIGAGASGLAARTDLLNDVLIYFGQVGTGSPTPVPTHHAVTVSAYPNPFNPTVRIDYSGAQDDWMRMDVYNIRGRHVSSLFDARLFTKSGFVTWNGTDSNGSPVPSGVYFLKASVGQALFTEKLTLVR